MSRIATVKRTTRETDIELTINIDGSGQSNIDTGIPFFDHMLDAFTRHGFFDLTLKAVGDLQIDEHHTMEDTGLVLGQAIKDALGDKKGIYRFGHFSLCMDETLVNSAFDLSGRPYLVYNFNPPSETVANINVRLFNEFFQALTNTLALNLHLDMIRGDESHHVIEASFKSFAKALDQATQLDSRVDGVLSTKGTLD